MTALECDIEYAKTEPEFSDVLPERGGVEEKNGGERSFGAPGRNRIAFYGIESALFLVRWFSSVPTNVPRV